MFNFNLNEPNKTYKEYKKFLQEHPIIFSILILIILGLLMLTLFNQNKLRNEIIEKDTKIQLLETQLIPFKTIALERFTGSEMEALRKLAEEIEDTEKRLKNFQNYSYSASLNYLGNSVESPNIIISSPVSRKLEGCYTKSEKNTAFECTDECLGRYESLIQSDPFFPFSYYYITICLFNNKNSDWVIYARKSLEILDETTNIEGHNSYHDEIKNKLLEMMDSTK